MQVMFKLTPEQQVVAKAIAKRHIGSKMPQDDGQWFFAGNLLGWMKVGRHTNMRQKLFLTPSGDYVRYEGDRHALQMDGGMAVLKDIAVGNVRNLRYTQYETSDTFLYWNQTTEDLIESSTDVKLLNWIKSKKHLTAKETTALKNRVSNPGSVFSKKIEIGTPQHRKMSASGDGWKVPIINHIHRLIET